MLVHVRSMTTSPFRALWMSAGDIALSENGERTTDPFGMAPSVLASFPSPNLSMRLAVHFLGSHWHLSKMMTGIMPIPVWLGCRGP